MTSIGPSVFITGEISSAEDIVIEGRVKGRVQLREGTVTIAPQGRVDAEVRGVRVLIEGELKGAVTATEHIELAPSASVTGILSANQVVIVEGARFNGRIDMGQRTIAAKVAQYKAEHTPARKPSSPVRAQQPQA